MGKTFKLGVRFTWVNNFKRNEKRRIIMCTNINSDPIGKEAIGWKVVVNNGNLVIGNHVCSFYKTDFKWKPNSLHFANEIYTDEEVINSYFMDSKVFHCFAKREDARRFKRNQKALQKRDGHRFCNMQIIKLKLSGAVFKGTTNGMPRPKCDNLPAICGNKAYWDGKFHR